MRRFLKILLLLVVVLIVGVFIVAEFFFPSEFIREQARAAVAKQTGFQLDIKGGLRLRFIPRIEVQIGDVTLYNPRAESTPITIEQLRVGVNPWPLINGAVVVDYIALVRPEIELIKSKEGRGNWQPPKAAPPEEAGAPASSAGDGEFNIAIHTISVSNARLSYTDEANGTTQLVDAVSLQAFLPALDKPLNAIGDFTYKGQAVDFDLQLKTLQALIKAETAYAALKVTSTGAVLAFEGAVNPAAATPESTLVEGAFGVRFEDIETLTGTLGRTGAGAGERLALNLDANLILTGQVARVNNLRFEGLGQALEGIAEVWFTGARPDVRFELKSGSVDLDALQRYGLLAEKSSSSANANSSANIPVARPAATTESKEAAITFPFKAFDMAGDIKVATLKGQGIDVSGLEFAALAKDGRLDANISASAYGTQAEALFTAYEENDSMIVGGLVKTANIDIAAIRKAFARYVPPTVPQVSGSLRASAQFASHGSTPSTLIANLSGGLDVKVANGRVSDLKLRQFFNNDPRADYVQDITLALSVKQEGKPLSLAASGLWRGDTMRFEANAPLDPLLQKKPANVAFRFSGSHLVLAFKGAVTPDLSAVNGKIDFTTPYLRAFIAWLGHTPPMSQEPGALTFAGDLKATPDRFTLANTRMTLAGTSAQGSASLDFSAKKPAITGDLVFDSLDITPLLASSEGGSAGGAGGGGAGVAKPAGGDKLPLEGLHAVNADIRAKVEKLLLNRQNIGRAALHLLLKDGHLNVDLPDLRFYEGAGAAKFALTSLSKDEGELKLNVDMKNVTIFPLLKDFADVRVVEGQGNLFANLTASGKSTTELQQTLAGKASFDLQDGAVWGINIPRMYRALTAGSLNWQAQPNEKTDFSEFKASFNVNQGVAQTDDIRIMSPFLRITGNGQTHIPAKSLDFHIEPAIVDTIKGQGGRENKAGLVIPVRIKGTYQNPKIIPDLKALARNPEALLNQAQQLQGLVEGATGQKLKIDTGAGQKLLNTLQGGGQQSDGGQQSIEQQGLGLLDALTRKPKPRQQQDQPQQQQQDQPQQQQGDNNALPLPLPLPLPRESNRALQQLLGQ